MSSINKDQLEKMVKESECDNNTDKLRELKYSKMIKENIDNLYSLKATHSKMRIQEPDKFDNLCKNQCSFLYTHYTLIYNKAFNDELDLKLLDELLKVLENIEDGKTDQHNGSVEVGEILKKIYIDSALKKSEKLDKEYASEKPVFAEPKHISYKEFKNKQ